MSDSSPVADRSAAIAFLVSLAGRVLVAINPIHRRHSRPPHEAGREEEAAAAAGKLNAKRVQRRLPINWTAPDFAKRAKKTDNRRDRPHRHRPRSATPGGHRP